MNSRPIVERGGWLWRAALALVAGAGALLVACGGGGGGDTPASTMGSARIYLTDAPTCGYDEVNITVERIRVHQRDDASPSELGWSELTLSPPRRIDILDLQNGVLEELGTLPLPVGDYHQVRLVLASNGGSTPLANSLRLSGSSSEIALTTPSAQQSGSKIKADFSVGPTQVADLVLDFDPCKSIVRAGNSGRYLLKPVITALPVFAAAGNAIEGWLDPTLVGATVSAQQAGVVRRSTVPDATTGRWLLSPLEVGSYDLVLSANGRATAVITGVPVIDTARTRIATQAAPLLMPALSDTRVVSGAVTQSGTTTIPEAVVRALQTYTGGPDIELAARPVDADTGAYSLTLPIAAPGRAAYDASASGYSFAADAAAAGLYTVQAQAEGLATLSDDVDLTSADATLDFVFP